VFGMFYVALLVARLVSLYSSGSALEAASRGEIADQQRIGADNSQTGSKNPEK
jgi:hypothetical protein